MKHVIISALILISAGTAFSQSKFSKNELSVNGFRNPSIGLEYRPDSGTFDVKKGRLAQSSLKN